MDWSDVLPPSFATAAARRRSPKRKSAFAEAVGKPKPVMKSKAVGKPKAVMKPKAVGKPVTKPKAGAVKKTSTKQAVKRKPSTSVVQNAQAGRSFALPATLREGSICSGMGVSIIAMRELGVPHTVEFACDSDPHAQKFLQDNFHMETFYSDCTTKEFSRDAPDCDILSAGPPCQAFSSQGLNLGTDDARGLVIFDVARYIRKRLPRIAIIENVRGLVSNHPHTFMRVLKIIKGATDENGMPAYALFWRVLNAKDFGVCQSRSRVYIVCIKKCGRDTITFKWPRKSSDKPSLADIFDTQSPVLDSYAQYPIPTGKHKSKTVRAALEVAKKRAEELGVAVESLPALVDTGCSKRRVYFEQAGCLTKSRAMARAIWSLQHARPLTVSEMLRIQGIPPDSVKMTLSPRQMGARIGNAFSLPVYRAILKEAIAAAEK